MLPTGRVLEVYPYPDPAPYRRQITTTYLEETPSLYSKSNLRERAHDLLTEYKHTYRTSAQECQLSIRISTPRRCMSNVNLHNLTIVHIDVIPQHTTSQSRLQTPHDYGHHPAGYERVTDLAYLSRTDLRISTKWYRCN